MVYDHPRERRGEGCVRVPDLPALPPLPPPPLVASPHQPATPHGPTDSTTTYHPHLSPCTHFRCSIRTYVHYKHVYFKYATYYLGIISLQHVLYRNNESIF